MLLVEFDKGIHHWHMMLGEKRMVKNNSSTRRPMGPLEDLYSIWNNRPLYDASQITSSVLVIYGGDEWFTDKDML
ncbi:hypothetical protein PDK09_27210 [Bacillus cereus]|nr:hypothetical protein [Bacillus cereus]MDA1769629.1 hypothetical protein [Bacillus cereus]